MARKRSAGTVEVAVTARTSPFQKGMRKAQNRLKKFKYAAKSTGGELAKLGGVLGLTFGTGALLGAIRTATQLGDKMGNLSEAVGIGTERLRALDTTLGISGISLDNYTKALTRSAQAVEYFFQGKGEYAQYFKDVGLEVSDFKDVAGDTEKQLFVILERLKEIQKTDKALALAGAANLIGSRNIRLLALTGSFENDIKQHLAITGNVSDEANAKLQETNKQIDLLQKGIRNAFDNAVAENAQEIQGVITKLSDVLPDAARGAADLATHLGTIVGFIAKHGDELAALYAGYKVGKKVPGPAPVKIGAGVIAAGGTYAGLGYLFGGGGKTSPAPEGSPHAARQYTDFTDFTTYGPTPRTNYLKGITPRAPVETYTGPTGEAIKRIGEIAKIGQQVRTLAKPLSTSDRLSLSGGGVGEIAGARVREQFDNARAASEVAIAGRFQAMNAQLADAKHLDPRGSKVQKLNKDLINLELTSKAVSAEWDRQAREVLPGLMAIASENAETTLKLTNEREAAEQKVANALEAQVERLAQIKSISDEVSNTLVSGLENIAFHADNTREAIRALGKEIAQLAFRESVSKPVASGLSHIIGTAIGGIGNALFGSVNLPANPPTGVTAKTGGVVQNNYFESGVDAAGVTAAIRENNDALLRATGARTYEQISRPGSRLASIVR